MRALGFAILLGFGGTFVGALWTFVVGLGGGPGAMLTDLGMRITKTKLIPTWGLIPTVAGQLYVALAFVACVVLTSRAHLESATGVGKWIAWFVAFGVSMVPVMAALKDSSHAERHTVQHGATVFTAPLAAIGYFVFVFVPAAIPFLWSWVPSF